ncbi:MAG: NAD(P)/FAD-dependent oxidoreductase, partial [Promicromonosporaceae bacterium]|nr:NAD(P)/FAD-dependent oxidoreductase [Promicromonosporaceae bacterium]
PLLSPDGGRVLGVRALGADREPLEFRSAVVVAADGVSSRFAVALGIPRREDRPLGTAYRAYYSAPLRGRDDWMENQLELWEGRPGRSELLPGYGWIFPVGDGVNIGLGSVSSSPARQARVEHNYRDLLRRYVATLPAEWQLEAAGPIRGAALPMGLGRTPLYARGTLLVGDAGGMVNPFNGEGIGYALLAGRLAAETIVEAHDAGSSPRLSEAELATYPRRIAAHLGGYFTLGRYFTRLIEHPQVMAFGTRYALPLPPVRRLLHQLLSDSYQTKGGDLTDRVITSLARLVPAA